MIQLTKYKKVLAAVGFVACFIALLIITILFSAESINEDLSFFLFVPSFILMIILANVYMGVALKSFFSDMRNLIENYKSKFKKL